MLDQRRMPVLERIDFIAKVYLVDLKSAANILGTKWDDVGTTHADARTAHHRRSRRCRRDRGAAKDAGRGVRLERRDVALSQKLEGMTVLNGTTLAIANDNDFGIGAFGGTGDAYALTADSGIDSQIRVVQLPSPIK